MIAIVPKWKVSVTFPHRPDVTFWVYDGHLANVIRKVADMQFTENGLEQPQQLTIALVKEPT